MAFKKTTLKSYKKTMGRKIKGKKTRGKKSRGGFSLFSNPKCSMSYQNLQNMSDGNVYNPRISNLYSKCGCKPGSQKSTCINIDYMRNSGPNSQQMSSYGNQGYNNGSIGYNNGNQGYNYGSQGYNNGNQGYNNGNMNNLANTYY